MASFSAEDFPVSISIGGASLAPQQLAAPQQKPAPAATVEPTRAEPPSRPPDGAGRFVDRKV
jgi:hypothetical protein